MATELIKVVDPDMGTGYDYDSLFDWEVAQQGDLTGARDEIAIAKCRCTGGTADTGGYVYINGWTTSATQYIKIWTDTSESYRHNGAWQTGNKYRLSLSNTVGIENNETDIVIDGLQIEITSANGNYQTNVYAAAAIIIKNCVIKGHTNASYVGGGISLAGPGNTYVLNCTIYNFNAAETNSMPMAINGAGTYYIYNCTLIGGYQGLKNSAGTVYAKNCYSRSNGGLSYNGTMTLTTCASSDTTGTAGLQSIALNTTNFVNVTSGSEDFHLPLGSALIGVATNLYNDAAYPFQTDIDGQDRGGAAASWDIGADEYVSSAAIEQEGFRFRNDDGSESAATWKANQDVNINLAADTAFRLRFLLKATGNPDSIDAQAEARVKPSGGAFGAWEKIN